MSLRAAARLSSEARTGYSPAVFSNFSSNLSANLLTEFVQGVEDNSSFSTTPGPMSKLHDTASSISSLTKHSAFDSNFGSHMGRNAAHKRTAMTQSHMAQFNLDSGQFTNDLLSVDMSSATLLQPRTEMDKKLAMGYVRLVYERCLLANVLRVLL